MNTAPGRTEDRRRDVFWCDVTTEIVLIRHVHTNADLDNNGNGVLFSDESWFNIHRGDGRFEYTVGEMNVMPTVVYLNEIVFGVGVLSWSVQAFCTNLVVIEGNSNAQRKTRYPLFQTNANITLFQHDNATSHTARDTVSFLRANNIAFINDWPDKSPDLNPIEHLWDNLDQRVRRRPIPPSNVIQLRQALIQVVYIWGF